MDDVYRSLLIFNEVLTGFNGHLKASLSELSKCHDAVSPVWNDEMRRSYEAEYSPLAEVIVRYAERDGPAYLDFLSDKVRDAKEYLYGQ